MQQEVRPQTTSRIPNTSSTSPCILADDYKATAKQKPFWYYANNLATSANKALGKCRIDTGTTVHDMRRILEISQLIVDNGARKKQEMQTAMTEEYLECWKRLRQDVVRYYATYRNQLRGTEYFTSQDEIDK
jgi:hypothetical protein